MKTINLDSRHIKFAIAERINDFIAKHRHRPTSIVLGRLQFRELSYWIRSEGQGKYISDEQIRAAKIEGIEIKWVDKNSRMSLESEWTNAVKDATYEESKNAKLSSIISTHEQRIAS